MTNVEYRYFGVAAPELRSAGSNPHITGHAAVFGKESRRLGYFHEVVNRGAFDDSKQAGFPDVVCRFQHDDRFILGTTAGGTLQLSVDADGLYYDADPPASRADIVELLQRGDIRSSSFAFKVPAGGDEWGLTPAGLPLRTLLAVELVDVAPVTTPAYPDATAQLRAFDDGVISLANRFSADPAEIRSLLEDKQGSRLFKTTLPKSVKNQRIYRPLNTSVLDRLAQLQGKRFDPYVDSE